MNVNNGTITPITGLGFTENFVEVSEEEMTKKQKKKR